MLYNKTISYSIRPCEISEKYAFCVPEKFTIPGTYIYELIIYDCAQIKRVLNISCDMYADYEEIKSHISPLASAKKVNNCVVNYYIKCFNFQQTPIIISQNFWQ